MVKKFFEKKINRNVYEIFAGEYHVSTNRKVAFKTLLGSCVSVCMLDSRLGIAGMNHFMLPSTRKVEDIVFNQDARYGINAMEMMINEMMKKGARRENLAAKVFGGGKVMANELTNVAQSNVEFVLSYLNMENITIKAKDLGGTQGRKVYFFPDTFDIYLKKIGEERKIKTAVAKEKVLLEQMNKKKKEEGELTLFD